MKRSMLVVGVALSLLGGTSGPTASARTAVETPTPQAALAQLTRIEAPFERVVARSPAAAPLAAYTPLRVAARAMRDALVTAEWPRSAVPEMRKLDNALAAMSTSSTPRSVNLGVLAVGRGESAVRAALGQQDPPTRPFVLGAALSPRANDVLSYHVTAVAGASIDYQALDTGTAQGATLGPAPTWTQSYPVTAQTPSGFSSVSVQNSLVTAQADPGARASCTITYRGKVVSTDTVTDYSVAQCQYQVSGLPESASAPNRPGTFAAVA